jgi:hypothetical protein
VPTFVPTLRVFLYHPVPVDHRGITSYPLDFSGSEAPETGVRQSPVPPVGLQRTQESNEVLFLLRRQLKFVDQVEELYRVFQREQTPIVHIGR